MSIGQLCDDGCIATFDKAAINITKEGRKILAGTRGENGLWTLVTKKKRVDTKANPTADTTPPEPTSSSPTITKTLNYAHSLN